MPPSLSDDPTAGSIHGEAARKKMSKPVLIAFLLGVVVGVAATILWRRLSTREASRLPPPTAPSDPDRGHTPPGLSPIQQLQGAPPEIAPTGRKNDLPSRPEPAPRLSSDRSAGGETEATTGGSLTDDQKGRVGEPRAERSAEAASRREKDR